LFPDASGVDACPLWVALRNLGLLRKKQSARFEIEAVKIKKAL